MAVELFFCEAFQPRKKKRERTAQPEVFTQGHAQIETVLFVELSPKQQ